MPEMTARQAAVQALMRVNHEGGYSNLVLNETLKKAQLSQSDAAFASKLFYGALERRLTLDSGERGGQTDPPDEGVKRLRLCQCGAAQLYSG